MLVCQIALRTPQSRITLETFYRVAKAHGVIVAEENRSAVP
jgi:hypothetical protein